MKLLLAVVFLSNIFSGVFAQAYETGASLQETPFIESVPLKVGAGPMTTSSDECCYHRGADGTCYHKNPSCNPERCECYHRGATGECYHCSCSDGGKYCE